MKHGWTKFFVLVLFLMTAFFGASQPAVSQETVPQAVEMASSDPVHVSLLFEEESIQPGHPFWVAVRVQMDDHWHAYWKNPGDAGMAIAINWTLPQGFQEGPTEWPWPARFTLNSMVGFGYEGEAILLTQITPPATLSNEKPVEIAATVRWVVCDDANCLPGESQASMKTKVSTIAPRQDNTAADYFKKARAKLPKKVDTVQAQKKNELIELSFASPSGSKESLSHAYFTPEEIDAIDYKAEGELSQNGGNYTLALRGNGQAGRLKGVAVLVYDQGHAEAIDVDVPIAGIAADQVGIADEKISIKTTAMTSEDFDFGFGWALVLAFMGGMILNLMPCVLPVISLKIMSFVKMAGQSRGLIFKHGIAFSAGVLVSFWTLGGVLITLQSYGQSAGWGFQLQEPLFVALLSAVLLVFGLSLFGVFEMGTSVASWAGQADQGGKKSGITGSFFSGILATAVATPCTGPFLGSAIGFASTLSAPLSLMIFTSLGLGMSAPYFIFSAVPSLMRFMPKPGPWMGTFKELMGFSMLATVLWLVWVFGAETNSLALTVLLGSFFFLSVGCWIYGKWGTPIKSKMTRRISYVLSIACFGLGAYALIMAARSEIAMMSDAGGQIAYADAKHGNAKHVWEKFSPERVEELRKQGIPVFIDFTAKWCLICQANHLVLSTPAVTSKFEELGVVKMKADWTRNDPIITEALRKFGRNGVPLYVYYSGNPTEEPVIMPQVLTPDIVIEHIESSKEIAGIEA